jgi:hypothetical protein
MYYLWFYIHFVHLLVYVGDSRDHIYAFHIFSKFTTHFPSSLAFINLTFICPSIVNVFPSLTKKMQRYTIYIFVKCSTCFRRFLRPSSGAQKLYIQHRVLCQTFIAYMFYCTRLLYVFCTDFFWCFCMDMFILLVCQ